MKKHFIILALLPINMLAQNSPFTREVEVERDYTPSVSEATRLTNTPQVQQPEQKTSNAPYSVWENVAQVEAPKQNLPATELSAPQYLRGDRFIRLGAGNYMSFLGDLFLPVISTEHTNWTFDAKHRSTFGKVTLNNDRKVQAKNMDNRLHTAFEHSFDNLIFAADAHFDHRNYNYYGNNNFISEFFPEMKEKAHFNDFGIGAGLRSFYSPENNLDFNASFNYNYFKTQADFTEHHLTAKGGFLKNFDSSHLGINVALDCFSYDNIDIHDFKTYAVFALNPYYTHFLNDLEIRFGLNAWFSGKGKFRTAASPDVKITYHAIENRLQLQAYAQGDYMLNSVARITHENPYIYQRTRMDDTYTPFDLGAGAKVKITDNIVIGANFGYRWIKNEYFYRPQVIITNMGENENTDAFVGWLYYVVDNQKTQQFYTNVSLEGNWAGRFNTLLSWNYNHWNVMAWHKPKHEIRLSGNYKITEKINFSASGYVAAGRLIEANLYQIYKTNYHYIDVDLNSDYLSDIELYKERVFDPIIDFSLGGTYKFNKSFTIFLQANNIFANKYYHWYGYNAHRFNAMAGVTFSF